MQALILAGGKGIRLRPLTIHTPKPILPIVNRPFILYMIDLLKHGGATDISLALSYQPGKIEEVIASGENYGVKIRYTTEPVPLGTAGAYRSLSENFDATSVVINGDILTSVDLNDVIRFHREKKALATIVTTPVSDPSELGVVEFASDGRIRSFVEKPHVKPNGLRYINAGIYILEPSLLSMIPSGGAFSFEEGLFPALAAAGEAFYAYIWEGYWIDIGTPFRYLKANQDVLRGCLGDPPAHSDGLPTFIGDGEPARIDAVSIIDHSCTIKAGAEISNSVLGANCFVEERARIENAVLFSGTRVGGASIIRNCVIGKGAIIGRNANVEGAILGDKSSLTDYTTI